MSVADELAEIGRRHGSDKWTGHHYAKPYAAHLGDLRHQPISLLEIGVGGYDKADVGGHSLRAWKEFFPSASIVGLDYFDKSPLEEERIRIFKGSQVDPRVIGRLVSTVPDGFDVVIDDGSHRSEHIIGSFYMLWQFVKPDGWYVIEDLQTAYWPNHGGKLHDVNSPLTATGFIKSLIDGLNWQEIHQPDYLPSQFDKEIVGMHFYHNIVFLQKGSNNEGSTEIKNCRIY